jgi:hypothetical protein
VTKLDKARYVDKVIASCRTIEQIQVALRWAIGLDLADMYHILVYNKLKGIGDESSDF